MTDRPSNVLIKSRLLVMENAEDKFLTMGGRVVLTNRYYDEFRFIVERFGKGKSLTDVLADVIRYGISEAYGLALRDAEDEEWGTEKEE